MSVCACGHPQVKLREDILPDNVIVQDYWERMDAEARHRPRHPHRTHPSVTLRR